MTSSIFLTMAGWTSDKFRLSCLENQGLKRTLLKMLILDNGNSKNGVSIQALVRFDLYLFRNSTKV